MAGVGVAAGVPAAGVAALTGRDLVTWAALAAGLALVAGPIASWWLASRGRTRTVDHALVGGALGVGYGAWAAVWAPDVPVAAVLGVLSVLVGAGVATVAVRVALALPDHVVRRTAVASSALVVAVVGAAVWVLADPTRGTDLVEVTATAEVEDRYEDGVGLARALGDAYEQRRLSGAPVLGTRAWIEVVGGELDRPLGEVELRSRTTPNLDLPQDPATGEPRRLISAVVRDREVAGCVIVTRAEVEVRPGLCHELEDP